MLTTTTFYFLLFCKGRAQVCLNKKPFFSVREFVRGLKVFVIKFITEKVIDNGCSTEETVISLTIFTLFRSKVRRLPQVIRGCTKIILALCNDILMLYIF
jgi:hypothetical protein